MSKTERTKVNFVLLKQILDEETASISTETDTESELGQHITDAGESQPDSKQEGKEKDDAGPVGRYPVVFSRKCRSKSCQTKLSAFPLFPVPEETEWISGDDDRVKRSHRKSPERKKKHHTLNKSTTPIKDTDTSISKKRWKVKNKETEEESSTAKTKNFDGTRKEFESEHQLKSTNNPVLLAWIHQKNKLARKMRREERKQKRAKRIALQEEERIKDERQIESEKSVSQWLKSKKKEARQAWRKNHPKINPFDMGEGGTSTQEPPPEYTVIETFTQPASSVDKAGSVGEANKDATCMTENLPDRNINAQNERRHNKVIVVQPNYSGSGKFDVHKQSDRQRPKSAMETSCQKENNKPRPQTAKGKSQTRPKTAKATTGSEQPSPKMQSLSYDEWLKQKREQDKKQAIKKKREIIDSHLDAVVAELGKQRVERILNPKKHVNTGLKNYPRSPSPAKTPVSMRTAREESPYRWLTEKKSPRPEPQGCDYPDNEHTDTVGITLNSKSNEKQDSPSPRSAPKKQAVSFCQDITEQCEGLKPSMDKVLAVLDSEIKKSTENMTTCAQRTQGLSVTGGTSGSDVQSIDSEFSNQSSSLQIREARRPKSARPTSARPRNAKPGLSDEQVKKKILSDLDVLGLCESPQANSSGVVEQCENQESSTVRENYFDYGSDVDPPSMRPVSTVDHSS
ncbi:uncharacterized protein LOC5511513 [Nematostella vectensis]|uniref:uncharacterized protein LOC5511513 n=1 Tax=Nematostella vectensis TaxID=45351 RepID=UPI002076DFB9|nr:uncharacterized protein LOC5511513 [Nematostella vectensis]